MLDKKTKENEPVCMYILEKYVTFDGGIEPVYSGDIGGSFEKLVEISVDMAVYGFIADKSFKQDIYLAYFADRNGKKLHEFWVTRHGWEYLVQKYGIV